MKWGVTRNTIVQFSLLVERATTETLPTQIFCWILNQHVDLSKTEKC